MLVRLSACYTKALHCCLAAILVTQCSPSSPLDYLIYQYAVLITINNGWFNLPSSLLKDHVLGLLWRSRLILCILILLREIPKAGNSKRLGPMLLDYSCGVEYGVTVGGILNLKLDSGMGEQQNSPDISANKVTMLFGCFLIPPGTAI